MKIYDEMDMIDDFISSDDVIEDLLVVDDDEERLIC